MQRFQFDATKDESNRVKHGVSLGVAAELDWDSAIARIDERFDYKEERIIALVPGGGVLYVVVFVDRDDVRRIISVRPANRREVRTYAQDL